MEFYNNNEFGQDVSENQSESKNRNPFSKLSNKLKNRKNSSSENPQFPILYLPILIPFLLNLFVCGIFYIDFQAKAKNISRTGKVKPLTELQTEQLTSILAENFASENALIKPLPYSTVPVELYINAKSAILVDTATGNILYEKDADRIIPPASMTKLVEMYVVFDAIDKGEVGLDDIVPLPPQSWAINLPSDASIMFLAEGQTVTLRELLLGLSIASGNDASIAVANYVAGDMESFVARMNAVIQKLGLKKTHFVESSGYSELNVTTAREFAAFCISYINRFPYAISEFHSQKVLEYPQHKNLPAYKQNSGVDETVVQYNTNKLLGKLEGVDGLKTGFINESGYNIALTAKRDSRRFLSVTMGGPGTGSSEGNYYRNIDGTSLMEFAFATFAPYSGSENRQSYKIRLLASKYKNAELIPAYEDKFSVPFIAGKSPEESAKLVKTKAVYAPYQTGEIKAGQQYGNLIYSIDDKVLQIIPLVADRNSRSKNKLSVFYAKALAFYSRSIAK